MLGSVNGIRDSHLRGLASWYKSAICRVQQADCRRFLLPKSGGRSLLSTGLTSQMPGSCAIKATERRGRHVGYVVSATGRLATSQKIGEGLRALGRKVRSAYHLVLRSLLHSFTLSSASRLLRYHSLIMVPRKNSVLAMLEYDMLATECRAVLCFTASRTHTAQSHTQTTPTFLHSSALKMLRTIYFG